MLTTPLTTATWSLVDTTSGTIVCNPIRGPVDMLTRLETEVAMSATAVPGKMVKVLRVPCETVLLTTVGAKVGRVLDLTGGVIPRGFFPTTAAGVTGPTILGLAGLTGATGLGGVGASVGTGVTATPIGATVVSGVGSVGPFGTGTTGVTGVSGVPTVAEIAGVTGVPTITDLAGVTGVGSVVTGTTGVKPLGVTGTPFVGLDEITDPFLAKRADLSAIGGEVVPAAVLPSGVGAFGGVVPGTIPCTGLHCPIIKPKLAKVGVDASKEVLIIAPGKLIAGDLYNTTIMPGSSVATMPAGIPTAETITGFGKPFTSAVDPTLIKPTGSFFEKAKTLLF